MTHKLAREKRVEDILEAAVEVFVDKGYEGASMEAIARQAGLTKGGVYHHFSGKDEIFLAANSLFMEPLYRMIAQALESGNPRLGLRSFIINYLQWWKDHPRDMAFVALTLYKALQNPDYWPEMSKYTAEMTAFYKQMLEAAVSAGEANPMRDTEARAFALMGAVDGLAAYIVMDPGLTAEACTEKLLRAFL